MICFDSIQIFGEIASLSFSSQLGAPIFDRGKLLDFGIFGLGLSNFLVGTWFPFDIFQANQKRNLIELISFNSTVLYFFQGYKKFANIYKSQVIVLVKWLKIALPAFFTHSRRYHLYDLWPLQQVMKARLSLLLITVNDLEHELLAFCWGYSFKPLGTTFSELD